eukprot:UN27213
MICEYVNVPQNVKSTKTVVKMYQIVEFNIQNQKRISVLLKMVLNHQITVPVVILQRHVYELVTYLEMIVWGTLSQPKDVVHCGS